MILKRFLQLFLIVIFLLGAQSNASSVYFKSSQESFVFNNEIFKVDLILDTENKNINAFESEIVFDKNFLDLKAVYHGGSLVDLWIKNPKYINDKIFFSGIKPGGINTNNGKMLSLVFLAKKEGNTFIELKNPKFLLNDDNGTEDFLNIQNLNIFIQEKNILETNKDVENKDTKKEEVNKNENNAKNDINNIIPKDETRPEGFILKIIKDPKLYDNKYFLIFSAQDKESGIDYYEIKEGEGEFIRGESPYEIKDQTLTKEIQVKAVDASGNYRIEKIGPIFQVQEKTFIDKYYVYIIISLLFLIFVLILLEKIRRDLKKKKVYDENNV